MHLRADGHAVQSRQLFSQQSAFQPRVDSQHLGLFAEHLPVNTHHGVPEDGILPEFPCGILPGLGITSLEELCKAFQLLQKIFLLTVDGASDGKSDVEPLSQFGDSHVQAGLHKALNILTSGLHPVGRGAEQADDLGRRLCGQAVAAQRIHVKRLNDGIRLVVFFPNLRLQFLRHGVDPLQLNAHSHQRRLTGTGNGVVLGAAGQGGQAQRHELLNAIHEFAHDLVGVGAVLVDLRAGMAALQAVHAEPDAGAVNRLPLCGQADGRGRAAGTGHGENPLILGIQIDHRPAFQFGQVDDIRAQHPDLLVHGDDDLQRRMGNGVVRQQRQSVGNGNAVVAAEGGAFGEHKLIVMSDIQPLLLHVQRAVHVLFAHHIHVPL